MLDDIAYWWRAGWWPRIGILISVGLVFLGLPWLAYDIITEPTRWAAYKSEHHCWLIYRPGQGGPDADGIRNGYYLYECDGIPVQRPPHSP